MSDRGVLPPDDPRDAHLREALRHAPDAQLQPPAALSALILQEARAKARGPHDAAAPTPPAAPRWIVALWESLSRPAVATGVTGVMAATLVGLMWWDQPLDELVLPQRPEAAAAAAPAAVPAPAPTAMPTPAGVAAPPATPTDSSADRKKADRRPAPAAPRAARPTPEPGRSPGEAEQPGRAEEPAVARSSGIAAPPPPAPAAPAVAAAPKPAAAERSTTADAAAPAAAPPQEDIDQAAMRQVLQAARSARGAEATKQSLAAKAELNELRAGRESAAFTAITSLLAELGTDPQRWRWQRGGATQPLNEDLLNWLRRLDTTTRGRWQPADVQAAGASAVSELRLLRDGDAVNVLRLAEREVLWQRGSLAWRCALEPDQLASLRAALDAATP
jgi:hypothetical protein